MGTEFGALLASMGLAWGLVNSGAPQKLLRDHYTHIQIPGKAGEDIEWTQVPGAHQPILVAVLDTGIDFAHPQIQRSIQSRGKNFASPQATAEDTHGHGTHVAGIILQVSRHAQILPIKVVQSGPNAPIRPQDVDLPQFYEPFPVMETGLSKNVAAGIHWALDQGARVINLSLAWPTSFRSLEVEDALRRAQELDAIVVASAGNDSTQAMVYPCLIESVICVGSLGPDGKPSHFTNRGDMVDLYAPGLAIVSSWPISKSGASLTGYAGLEARNGTSMAAPFVSGAAAELLSAGWSAVQVREKLILGARPDKKLSLRRAIHYQPEETQGPWIRPANKGQVYLDWDGQKRSTPINFPYYVGDRIQTLTHSLHLEPDSPTQLSVTKTIAGASLHYTVHLRHVLKPQNEPRILGLDIAGLRDVRTLTPTHASTKSSVDFSVDLSVDLLALGSESSKSSSLKIQNLNSTQVLAKRMWNVDDSAQFLKFFRKLNRDIVAFVAFQKSSVSPARIEVQTYGPDLLRKSTVSIDPKITQVSERIRWIRSTNHPLPLEHLPLEYPCWISIGLPAPKDMPAFDPWKIKNGIAASEPRIYRVYCVIQDSLRSLTLPKSVTPIEILPNGDLVLARGDHYFVEYQTAKIEIQDPAHQQGPAVTLVNVQSVLLSPYRMLIGLSRVESTVTEATPRVTFWGPSTPGSIRITAIPFTANPTYEDAKIFDEVLLPTSPLESLVNLTGLQLNPALSSQGAWVQSHYDHLWYPAKSRSDVLTAGVQQQPARTSLNRYSLIPNLIFSRSFYPTEVRLKTGELEPALYTPALKTNGDQTELVVLDSKQNQLWRPARFKTFAPGCLPVADLIFTDIDGDQTPTIAYLCQDQLVRLPLLLP
jgi:hypothetical protein